MNVLQRRYTQHRVRCSSFIHFGILLELVLLALIIVYPIDGSAKQNTKIKTQHYQLDTVRGNQVAPDFSLPDRRGINHRLSEYKGRVVIINFWSTWCIPCRKEMPSLERAWQQLKPSGAILLGVAMQDELESINLFMEQSPVSFPILLDRDGVIASSLQTSSVSIVLGNSRLENILYHAL